MPRRKTVVEPDTTVVETETVEEVSEETPEVAVETVVEEIVVDEPAQEESEPVVELAVQTWYDSVGLPLKLKGHGDKNVIARAARKAGISVGEAKKIVAQTPGSLKAKIDAIFGG